jgi:hypothetical protein
LAAARNNVDGIGAPRRKSARDTRDITRDVTRNLTRDITRDAARNIDRSISRNETRKIHWNDLWKYTRSDS